MSTNHSYLFEVRSTTEGTIEELTGYLKEKRAMQTCFLADNDMIAAVAMRVLIENGYRIPEDISIIGFDNIPICKLISPPLLTMNVPK